MKGSLFLSMFALVILLLVNSCKEDDVLPTIGTVTDPAGQGYTWVRMADGLMWTIQNLNYQVSVGECCWYFSEPVYANPHGRLYDVQAAKAACESLGTGWRLPEEWEWNRLVTRYAKWDDPYPLWSHSGYEALIHGGTTCFDASLSGMMLGTWDLLQEFGFYWTSTESISGSGAYLTYVFRSDIPVLERSGYDQQHLFSVRCVKN